ncbi:MAG: ATP phosphoribosyltransferase regulatory subunit, partial [Methylocella sp.]
ARFTGNLDYYTGFVFEAHEQGAAEPAIGGGRYDWLPQTLGAKQPIPAIGAAIWIGRLSAERGAP